MRRLRLVFACLTAALGLAAEQVQFTVLATTDLHGYIFPYDYYTGQPEQRGLAKIATLVEAVRLENPNHLLIDCGDTIQGSPLESVYQQYVRTGSLPLKLEFAGEPPRRDPMMLVMNHMRYDAMALGNHEFNFGLRNLEQARSEAGFPWLSANTEVSPQAEVKPFAPYIVKTVGGVKVAVIGVTTPAVPSWEKPEHYRGLRFVGAREAVELALAELRVTHKPDIVIVAAHMGLGRTPKSGERQAGSLPGENAAYEIAARVPGIDAVVFGHSHQTVEELRAGDVLLVQPKNWGRSLARIDFVLERTKSGWMVARKRSRLIPVTERTAADPEILRTTAPYHELTERYLQTPVAISPVEMDGRRARIRDTPLVDAIHEAQLYYAKADVSFASLFHADVTIPKGPVTVRQIAALYVYDNELYAIEGTGRMVKEALENAARYFLSCRDARCEQGPLINSRVLGFNYDMAQGVEYEIDLTQPEAERVRNLRFQGQPLDPERKLRIAVNNYRAAGSAGYGMFRDAKVLWRSNEDIRSLIVEYYAKRGTLPARADGNWRLVPPAAEATIEREAARAAAR